MNSVKQKLKRRRSTDFVVGGVWKIVKKLGSGSFGAIYLAESFKDYKYYAVKLETCNTEFPQLEHERNIYVSLKGGVGIPNIYWFGLDGVRNEYRALVMEYLGPSLEDLFSFCKRKLSIPTVLMLAQQMIVRVEYLHSNNIIHRDIKPDNFVMGQGQWANHVYIVDFGLSKLYKDKRTNCHIQPKTKKGLTGSPRYASINTHNGLEQSRRDDMESIGYCLVYFLKGQLPWQGLAGDTKKQKYERIREKKISTPLPLLCRDLPDVFQNYLSYCRELSFEETPDYKRILEAFSSVFHNIKLSGHCKFDWEYRKTNQI